MSCLSCNDLVLNVLMEHNLPFCYFFLNFGEKFGFYLICFYWFVRSDETRPYRRYDKYIYNYFCAVVVTFVNNVKTLCKHRFLTFLVSYVFMALQWIFSFIFVNYNDSFWKQEPYPNDVSHKNLHMLQMLVLLIAPLSLLQLLINCQL